MDLPLGAVGTDVQAQAWIESVTSAYGWVLLVWAVGAAVLLLFMTVVFVPAVRRRFWCAGAQRDVEVEFEECGVPGRRRRIAVISCSTFDPPTKVQCDRACLMTPADREAGGERMPLRPRRAPTARS